MRMCLSVTFFLNTIAFFINIIYTEYNNKQKGP